MRKLRYINKGEKFLMADVWCVRPNFFISNFNNLLKFFALQLPFNKSWKQRLMFFELDTTFASLDIPSYVFEVQKRVLDTVLCISTALQNRELDRFGDVVAKKKRQCI